MARRAGGSTQGRVRVPNLSYETLGEEFCRRFTEKQLQFEEVVKEQQQVRPKTCVSDTVCMSLLRTTPQARSAEEEAANAAVLHLSRDDVEVALLKDEQRIWDSMEEVKRSPACQL